MLFEADFMNREVGIKKHGEVKAKGGGAALRKQEKKGREYGGEREWVANQYFHIFQFKSEAFL